MATPTVRLVQVLRDTADSIEDGSADYLWLRPTHCNCGLVMRRLLSCTPVQLLNEVESTGRKVSFLPFSWGALAYSCIDIFTGRTKSSLFRKLMSLGLARRDFYDLEGLSNKKVLRRMKKTRPEFWLEVDIARNDAKTAAAYMRTWADMLEEQLPPNWHCALPLTPLARRRNIHESAHS
jgi:hypothetical protein